MHNAQCIDTSAGRAIVLSPNHSEKIINENRLMFYVFQYAFELDGDDITFAFASSAHMFSTLRIQ